MSREGDIKSPRILYLKGFLFLFLGLMAAANLLVLHPEPQVVGSLLLAIWAFSRAYYFAFYVVHHYIDESYHFAGLWDFARYVMSKRKR